MKAPGLKRIPSLDGLRAVSILMVMGQHSLQQYGDTHKTAWYWEIAANGGLGVYIFFVISGYLITNLLMHEREQRGAISLKGFYLRRAFRILPPLYFYIAVIVILSVCGFGHVLASDALASALFYRNYDPHVHTWELEHTWSLCIEEQFYLIWPLTLVWCLRKRTSDGGFGLAAKIALAVICVSPLIRLASFKSGVPYLRQGDLFHMRADALMFGCIAAIAAGNAGYEKFYRAATRVWWLPPLLLFGVFSALTARFQNYWNYPVGFTATGLSAAIFLVWCVRNPTSFIGRILNNPVVAWVGTLSYSLYLWQTLFLHGNVDVFGGRYVWSTFPGNWLSIFAIATFSFYVIERPSLQLRNRVLTVLHTYRARGADARQTPAISREEEPTNKGTDPFPGQSPDDVPAVT